MTDSFYLCIYLVILPCSSPEMANQILSALFDAGWTLYQAPYSMAYNGFTLFNNKNGYLEHLTGTGLKHLTILNVHVFKIKYTHTHMHTCGTVPCSAAHSIFTLLQAVWLLVLGVGHAHSQVHGQWSVDGLQISLRLTRHLVLHQHDVVVVGADHLQDANLVTWTTNTMYYTSHQ